MIGGIGFGLGAAFSLSLSYLFSRVYVGRYRRGTLVLLATSHVIMGVFSLLPLPLLWPDTMPELSRYIGPLAGSALYYLAGQAGLFMALRTSDASRIAPLLGLKILILAFISVAFLGKSFSAAQWAGVALSVLAAGVLNWTGGRLAWQSVGWVLFTCVGYSLSDLSMKMLMNCFGYLGLMHAAVLSTCLCYTMCGVAGLLCLPFVHQQTRQMWSGAVPFSIAWLLAMLFLFACFGSIGVVFGNIVQSTRGVISILMGWMVAKAGYESLERKVTTRVLVQRAAAAGLMVGAIALFYSGT